MATSSIMYIHFPQQATHRIGKRYYRLPAFVVRRTQELAAEAAAGYAAYLADCESDRERGYRAHYCEHGTNKWTDYDNICGGCEEGITNGDPLQVRERALMTAKREYAKAETLMSASMLMREAGIGYDAVALIRYAAKIIGADVVEWNSED